jgi:glycosyltransferase involved in cell wall biosynthesis
VPPGARTILAMGRLHRAKGFDVLIAAMTRLPAIHAIIAGDGPERAALTDLAARAGIAARTHFLGWRTDTAALLAACDLLVCPSRHEPLGSGILVPAESGIALAAAIEAMLANPDMAARMAAAGRAHFETHFAQAPVVRAWQDFCHTVEKA